MNVEDVNRILIIGAGHMGREIGFQCAYHGYDVVLHDADAAILESLPADLKTLVEPYVRADLLDGERVQAALSRLSTEADPAAAAAGADLVSESVPEDPKLKGRVFSNFHDLCPAHTIFTTNTSTLVPSQFARATGRPAQFAAFHFHTPVWVSNVVDVMPHPDTAPETVSLLEAFAHRIGQIPIVLHKEHHGYVFNSLLNVLLGEAMTLVEQGVANPEDVDRAWMGVMRTEIGPFGIIDLVGLDTVWKITDYWAGRLFWRRQLRRNANYLKARLEEGRHGRDSGRGFYNYPNPAFEQPGFVPGRGSETGDA
ncbi:MAG: 3-hydroxyacyl-CoA dehydrogenase [Candidatus Promineifilaceae bacterium]|nr:3-hydroxyacyl-CoA dehydrogenase [Candidatus Promineifilaceae bacterium]